MSPSPLPSVRHGVDLVEVERFRELMARNDAFEARVFTEAERAYCRGQADPVLHFAARFAAKEALLKALGIGLAGAGMHAGLRDVEVVSEGGPPRLVLRGRPAEAARALGIGEPSLSITHTRDHACASVVALQAPAAGPRAEE